MKFKKPDVGKTYPVATPAESDEFETTLLGKQWQWQANPEGSWLMPSDAGHLKLYTVNVPSSYKNLLDVPNILTQKMPADEFMATTKLKLIPNDKLKNERAGFTVLGENYSTLFIRQSAEGPALYYAKCINGLKSGTEQEKLLTKVEKEQYVYLRVEVRKGAVCNWSYSLDGQKFIAIEDKFVAKPGRWIGATLGLYAIRDQQINDSGYADVDWLRIEKLR